MDEIDAAADTLRVDKAAQEKWNSLWAAWCGGQTHDMRYHHGGDESDSSALEPTTLEKEIAVHSEPRIVPPKK